MSDFIILIIAVPLMAFLGLASLGSAILAIYRDVFGLNDKVSEWLDREIGTGWGLGEPRPRSFLGRLVYAGLAVVFAMFAYALLRYGVVEPIAWHVFGYNISGAPR